MASLLGLVAMAAMWSLSTAQTRRELTNPYEWDVSEQGPLYLHLVPKEYVIPSSEEGVDAGTWLTRIYCWGNTSDLSEINQTTSCGIPGPTIVLHPNDEVQPVYLVNNLVGTGTAGHESGQGYKDPDVINLHVHGLNVYPKVDDIVDIWLDPICCDDCSPETDNCMDASSPKMHKYNYTIHTTHYPGTHWYHGHWHGSTALHVNGGMYGVIKMKAYDDIDNLKCYEPQVDEGNEHIIAASFVWLNSNDTCYDLIDKVDGNSCGFGQARHSPDFVYPAGKEPFWFAIQGWCWIQCKFSEDAKAQYDKSEVKYSVGFDENGPWNDTHTVKTFLINGVVEPTLTIQTGEWHRLRIVNTNMAYLIWQLNFDGDTDSDYERSVGEDVCQQWFIGADGVYFNTRYDKYLNLTLAPRLISNPPYNGSIVLPPGGRADVMIMCFIPGTYTVISSDNTRETLFSNAPVPNFVAKVMDIVVEGDPITGSNASSLMQCQQTSQCDPNVGSGLPCEFIPKEQWSPYLSSTESLVYPDVTAACQTPDTNRNTSQMNQCNIVLQPETPGSGGSLSVNHIRFSAEVPLLNLATDTTHEWLVTSNFHQFHQHIWPYQLQTQVVDGWLADIGEWRDVVGAPGSYIARSNFFGTNLTGNGVYTDFFEGKLVHHCHFVPHEDHGLMAYHELEEPPTDYNMDPIIPAIVRANESNFDTNYSAPSSDQWVTECTEFIGISSVIVKDINTIIIIYFRQFKYLGYCFFGYLPITVFRAGQVSNAFIAFGLWGSYQDNFENVVMDGQALAFTMQASESGILGDLDELYVAEVLLNSTTHGFDENKPTPAVCSNITNGGSFLDSRRQFRYFYCVRPRTKDYGDGFDASDYEFAPGKTATESFGYAYAYGEGQFYEKTMHASRGTCGMFFNLTETAEVDESEGSETLETSIDFLEQEALQCIQEGVIVGETSGQKVIVNRTDFPIADVLVDAETFMMNSGYDISTIPTEIVGEGSTSTMMPAGNGSVSDMMNTTMMGPSEDGDDDTDAGSSLWGMVGCANVVGGVVAGLILVHMVDGV